jgi:hypothetical protein
VAVARTKAGGWLGPVLAEAKSYPAETRSRCAAEGKRTEKIERRLAETRRWLDVSESYAACWIDERYQAANRLTFVRWFHEVLGERAWLANVYVVEDPDSGIATTKRQWLTAIEEDKRCLGVAETDIPEAGAVFIRGRHRSELLDR